MKKIGIMPNLLKDEALCMTKEVIEWLEKYAFEIVVAKSLGEVLGESLTSKFEVLEEKQLFRVCDAIIAIGGDGTILSVAQRACHTQIPIIGINLGRLGFLADIESTDMQRLMDKLLDTSYTIEERMMLAIKVIEPSGETHYFEALNDVSITRSNFSRITEFEVQVNNQFVDFYAADGLLVATPTGSTAYNLSAGGPIVSPSAKVMILTPVCPHTIASRPIVVADTDHILVKTYNHNGTQLELAVDGQTKGFITPRHKIEIEKAAYTTKLIKLQQQDFFDILRKKIVERHR